MQYLNKAEYTSRKRWDEFLCIEIRSSLFEFRRFDLSAQRVYFVFSFSFFLYNHFTRHDNECSNICSDVCLSYSVLYSVAYFYVCLHLYYTVKNDVINKLWQHMG